MKKKVEEIMTRNVIYVKRDDPLINIAKIFKENKISGVPVLNDLDEIVGVVSKADILSVFEDSKWDFSIDKALNLLHFQHEEKFHNIKQDIEKASKMRVKDVMSKDPKVVHKDDSIDDIAMIMHSTGFNRLPVTGKSNKLVGIVTRADIIASLYDI